MIHTWTCENCKDKFETSCCSVYFENGQMKYRHDDPEYMRRLRMGLCEKCFSDADKIEHKYHSLKSSIDAKKE